MYVILYQVTNIVYNNITFSASSPCSGNGEDWEYVEVSRKCYYRSSVGDGLSYHQARDHCVEGLDSTLLVVETDTERQHFQQLVYDSQYIFNYLKQYGL